MSMLRKFIPALLLGWTLLALSACRPAVVSETGTGLKVVATTTLVGDVVRQVGGELVEVSVLLPANTDPHGFEPAPKDLAHVAEAQVIFANGVGLETFLEPMLENSGGQAEIVFVSDGVPLLQAATHEDEDGGSDPHTWFDPNNVMIWTQNIERKLSVLDPSNAQTYSVNSEKYQEALRQLDEWIAAQVEQVPPDNRKLVTDHVEFTYFAGRYGFEQVGALIPGYSTAAQPSAQELAALEDAIRSLGVQAVFVGENVNPSLAERVVQDTGVKLVTLFTGSLSDPGGPAPTYLDFMRYNVTLIVSALK